MHQHCHAYLGVIDSEPQPLNERVLIIETRVNALDRAEHAALAGFGWITQARAAVVAIEIIRKTAAVTVIQAGAHERVRIFKIRRTAEPNVPARLKPRR